MKIKTSMNLFEIMEVLDQLDKRLDRVEKFSHEPQNYKKKCDEMERRIKKMEKELKIKYDNRTEKEIIDDWKTEINERKNLIENVDNI
jgi:ribosome assembly protein YihI (activator of Der GTPase)